MEFYKKIFRSKSLRFKILKALSRVPDRYIVPVQYRLKTGRWPNLKNPRRFTEKLQIYKMKYRNPLLPVLVDKYKVKEYLSSHGFGSLLPELYGVYQKGEEIDFDSLPERFVLKTNDGGGGNNVIICRDKSKLDIPQTVETLNSWLNVKSVNPGREWAYTGINESMILVEEYLENPVSPESGLEDYKFLCYNGQPHFIVHDGDRFIGHKRNFYDTEWNNLHIDSDCESFPADTPKPENLNEMLEVARRLSNGFPFVRVDLYNVEGKIYFGELTFYPWSGYVNFSPDHFDFRFGENFDISVF